MGSTPLAAENARVGEPPIRYPDGISPTGPELIFGSELGKKGSTLISSTSGSVTPDTPMKILVSLDKDGRIQVLDDELLDLIGGAVALSASTSCANPDCEPPKNGNNCFCPGHLTL
jgi:hypothetical protein